MGALTAEMQRLVREQRLGYVATVAADGSPNVSPKGSLTVLDDDNLVFADVESPHTLRNLATNPRTEINVVDPLARKGFRFRGVAEILRAGTTFWKVLEMYRQEGSEVQRIRSVVVVFVKETAPLVSPIYKTQIEEASVRAIWEEYHAKRKLLVTDLVPPRDF
jgi:uncharacterized protein